MRLTHQRHNSHRHHKQDEAIKLDKYQGLFIITTTLSHQHLIIKVSPMRGHKEDKLQPPSQNKKKPTHGVASPSQAGRSSTKSPKSRSDKSFSHDVLRTTIPSFPMPLFLFAVSSWYAGYEPYVLRFPSVDHDVILCKTLANLFLFERVPYKPNQIPLKRSRYAKSHCLLFQNSHMPKSYQLCTRMHFLPVMAQNGPTTLNKCALLC